jgi:guanosine-3',5'-bis(diphosphate) 3'-pyrophosphohydrolase
MDWAQDQGGVMNLTTAIIMAAEAHEGQTDKHGEPYILHPLRVMLAMKHEDERIVAVLHDVVEDTEVTLDELTTAGFSPEVVAAVNAISRDRFESSQQYYDRIKLNPLARRVKLADLTDNMDISRIPVMTLDWEAKIRYYGHRLQELIDA